MKALKEFVIPFVGLKEGVHDFAFEIDAPFFESFEYSEISRGKLDVKVSMEKQSRMLIFTFAFKGFVNINCDRCMAEMEYPVEGGARLIVKFGQELMEESDEVLIIPEKESQIDLSGFIYEYIVLSLPYQRMHPDGEGLCDSEVIEKLNEHSEQETDPRWEVLKNLKENIE